MRVMVMVKATEESEAGVLPDEKLLAAMGKFNEELVKAGVMLAGRRVASELQRARASSSREASGPSPTDPSPRPKSWSPASGCGR